MPVPHNVRHALLALSRRPLVALATTPRARAAVAPGRRSLHDTSPRLESPGDNAPAASQSSGSSFQAWKEETKARQMAEKQARLAKDAEEFVQRLSTLPRPISGYDVLLREVTDRRGSGVTVEEAAEEASRLWSQLTPEEQDVYLKHIVHPPAEEFNEAYRAIKSTYRPKQLRDIMAYLKEHHPSDAALGSRAQEGNVRNSSASLPPLIVDLPTRLRPRTYPKTRTSLQCGWHQHLRRHRDAHPPMAEESHRAWFLRTNKEASETWPAEKEALSTRAATDTAARVEDLPRMIAKRKRINPDLIDDGFERDDWFYEGEQ